MAELAEFSAQAAPVARPERQISEAAFYGIAASVVAFDQIVKALVRAKIPVNGTIALWPGVFQLTHTQNHGMAFSLLEGATWLLATAAFFVMAVIVWVQKRHGKTIPALLGLALALPLGGAAGNLADRLIYGYVTDLFDFRAINFPVFNVADAAITVGVGLLAFRTLTQDTQDTADTPENAAPSALAPQE